MPTSQRHVSRSRLAFGWMLVACLAGNASRAAAQPAIPGYADFAAFKAQVAKLDEAELISVKSLGKTRGGSEVLLLTVDADPKVAKPAILVVGSVHAPHLAGSELAVRMVETLVAKRDDESIRKLLDRVKLYVIPRPSPDASERFFRTPQEARTGNERPTDDDRDGELDEDPADDLDGNGVITMMRVEDPAGTLFPHPDDPRVLIAADPKKNERGRWKLLPEGLDNDGDEEFNEDGPGGVDFNQNFTFKYPYFAGGAGPHQVSEIETRAVADFAFDYPEIAVVFSFAPQDNLMHPWKPGGGSDGKYKTQILPADAPYFEFLAEKFRNLHGGKEPPEPAGDAGAFVPWAHFHYGRWSLATRGWWPPPTPVAEGTKLSDEKRGAAELNSLRWLKAAGIDGFVDWKPIEHPGFPGQRVEVGGFKPHVLLNPPIDQLPPLAEKHVQYLAELTGLMPRLALTDTEIEPLGEGVLRVSATVVNEGYLPTASAMGAASRYVQPVQVELSLPEGAKLLTGNSRTQLPTLAGNGGQEIRRWVVQAGEAKAKELKLRAWSPSVGAVEQTLKWE